MVGIVIQFFGVYLMTIGKQSSSLDQSNSEYTLGVFLGLVTAFGTASIFILVRRLKVVDTWVMLLGQGGISSSIYSLLICWQDGVGTFVSYTYLSFGLLLVAGIANVCSRYL